MILRNFNLLIDYFCLLVRWVFISCNFFLLKKKYRNYTLDDCEIFYINLEHRIDRLKKIEDQFSRLGIYNAKKIKAIRNDFGALGCALSHKSIYEQVIDRNKLIVICEDDVVFHCSKTELENLINTFYNDSRLDVLCLAHKSKLKMSVSDVFYITPNIQTMSCYVLKPSMVTKFIFIANQSISGLMNGKTERTHAIDQVWKKLQSSNIFVVPKLKCVTQGQSYSDIRKKVVNYNV